MLKKGFAFISASFQTFMTVFSVTPAYFCDLKKVPLWTPSKNQWYLIKEKWNYKIRSLQTTKWGQLQNWWFNAWNTMNFFILFFKLEQWT